MTTNFGKLDVLFLNELIFFYQFRVQIKFIADLYVFSDHFSSENLLNLVCMSGTSWGDGKEVIVIRCLSPRRIYNIIPQVTWIYFLLVIAKIVW